MEEINLPKPSYATDILPFLIAHNNVNEAATSPHIHPQYEFHYNICGNKHYFIDGKFFKVHQHTLIIIPPLKIHRAIRDPHVKYDSYVINFTDELFKTLTQMPMIGESERIRPSFFDMSLIGAMLPYTVTFKDTDHRKMVKLLKRCQSSEQASDTLQTLSAFIEILRLINKCYDPFAVDDESVPENWSDRVLQYAENHLYEDISVTQIAQSLYVNRTHLMETFKKETKMTIHHYITLRRLSEAQKLLLTGYNVGETAAKTGFKTLSHFTKTFKQEFGTTPIKFVKDHI